MLILALLFLVTAVLYASVGFGGGSTYNALLVLADTDYRILPSVALACNLIVVAGGVWQYRRSGELSLGFAFPFVVLSIPMAWFGGSVPIQRDTFVLLLGLSLLAAGIAMWFQPSQSEGVATARRCAQLARGDAARRRDWFYFGDGGRWRWNLFGSCIAPAPARRAEAHRRDLELVHHGEFDRGARRPSDEARHDRTPGRALRLHLAWRGGA